VLRAVVPDARAIIARVSVTPAAAGVRAILLDVEGTTTPLAFVVERLFPYARTHLRRHVEQHATEPEYARLWQQLRDEHDSNREAGQPVPSWVDTPVAAHLASVVAWLEWLMERDRKSTVLKGLQGRVWEEGYRRGELVGEVFADVPPAFERWRARGLAIGIFSSGSVLAQQLLFRHSSAGDLTGYLRWHFDTTTGRKADAESYHRIAAAMTIPPAAVLFISDVVRELDAARAAGMQTRLALRPGNAAAPDGHGHDVAPTFDEVV
jgi:enolase-phosphatase E1